MLNTNIKAKGGKDILFQFHVRRRFKAELVIPLVSLPSEREITDLGAIRYR